MASLVIYRKKERQRKDRNVKKKWKIKNEEKGKYFTYKHGDKINR